MSHIQLVSNNGNPVKTQDDEVIYDAMVYKRHCHKWAQKFDRLQEKYSASLEDFKLCKKFYDQQCEFAENYRAMWERERNKCIILEIQVDALKKGKWHVKRFASVARVFNGVRSFFVEACSPNR